MKKSIVIALLLVSATAFSFSHAKGNKAAAKACRKELSSMKKGSAEYKTAWDACIAKSATATTEAAAATATEVAPTTEMHK